MTLIQLSVGNKWSGILVGCRRSIIFRVLWGPALVRSAIDEIKLAFQYWKFASKLDIYRPDVWHCLYSMLCWPPMEACMCYWTSCMAGVLVPILVVLWHMRWRMTLLLWLLVGTMLPVLQKCRVMLGLRNLPFRGVNTDLWSSGYLGL